MEEKVKSSKGKTVNTSTKTTQNKKNSTIETKQKIQIKNNENKVVQNYINSYTWTIVSNIDFWWKLSHKDQITANANSDNPQNVVDFYLPNWELTYKNKEIFEVKKKQFIP